MGGKKVVIIGGGISGLVSGIFALKNGYTTTIYEKNSDVGGLLLRGSYKKDYLNDNYAYFYYDKELKSIYDEIGLDNIEEVENEYYLQYKGIKIYKDLNKLEDSLIKKYVCDEKKIKSFFKIIKEAKNICLFNEKPLDCLNFFEPIKYNAKMKVNSKMYNKYHFISIEKYFSDFYSKEIKDLFSLFMPSTSSIYNLIILLAKYSDGTLKRINLNSYELINLVKEKYIALGGKIEVNKIAESLDIDRGKVMGVWFNNKHYVNADYVISAIDINYTFKVLLKGKYNDRKFKLKFEDYKSYPTYSLISLDFLLKDKVIDIPYVFASDVTRKRIASSNVDKLLFINRGNGIISCNIIQTSEDYIYWKLLSKNSSILKKELSKVVENIKEDLTKVLKEMFDIDTKLKELGYLSPLDYEEKYNCYKGSTYSFDFTSKGKIIEHNGRIENVRNLYLASQWLSTPGGIMNACINGYYAIVRMEFDKKKMNNLK